MKRTLIFLLLFSTFFITELEASVPRVYLGGETVAIQGDYNGVIISGMYDFKIEDQWISVANENNLKVKDKIIKIEDKEVKGLDDLYEYLSFNPKENAKYRITVVRDNTIINTFLKVYYLKEDKIFKTGLYVKDKIKGIGTITFYNPINQSYGALGHEIMDADLNKPAEITAGSLFLASVNAINPSRPDHPGEKTCFNTRKKIATIEKNNAFGLYGHYVNLDATKLLVEVGNQKDIVLDKAIIYTVTEGSIPEKIDILITKVNYQTEKQIKGIQFEIIDTELLEKTGGIVQGMSGSPIIQNGKIIGAVTHMITSTPAKGYGIHIEWMLNESLDLK